MKIKNLALVLGSASAFVFAVACSSSSGDDSAAGNDAGSGSDTSTGGGDSGGPTDSGGGGNTCKTLADGTYTQHNTATSDGGVGCPPPDSTFTIPAPAVDAGPVVDSGPNPCTISNDTATCTTTTTCSQTTAVSGYNSTGSVTVGSDGISETGTQSTTITSGDGGIISSCSYTYTVTKQ